MGDEFSGDRAVGVGRTADSPSLDTLLDALANPYRRHVIRALLTAAEPRPLAALSADVAARENDVPTDDIPDEEVTRVSVSLYHWHLPKLEDAGIVAHDGDGDAVELLTESATLTSVLDVLEG